MAATWLADALRAGGCAVDETVVPNWKARGHTDGPFAPVGVLGHHTAGARTGDLPSLAIVRDGRPDLGGPLANLMLSRGGVFVPIAAGRAWHAGAADRPASFPWVPHGDGNGYLIGIEAESCGVVDDWTAQQRAAYPLGVAALLRYLKQPASRFLGHKEWAPSRKVDPAFIDLNAFRATVTTYLNPPPAPAPVPQPDGDAELNSDQDLRLTQARDAATDSDNRAGYILTGQNTVVIPLLQQLVNAQHSGEPLDVDKLVADITAGVSQQLLGSVDQVVKDELGADNAAQADAIVAKLGEVLSKRDA